MGEFESGIVVGVIVGIAVGIPLGWVIAQIFMSTTPKTVNPEWKTIENIEEWEMWEDESGKLQAKIRRKVKRIE